MMRCAWVGVSAQSWWHGGARVTCGVGQIAAKSAVTSAAPSPEPSTMTSPGGKPKSTAKKPEDKKAAGKKGHAPACDLDWPLMISVAKGQWHMSALTWTLWSLSGAF